MTDLAKRALAFVAGCDDPAKLQRIVDNARAQGEDAVMQAAQRRLYAVRPAAATGTLEHAVWQSIYALEDALKQERGKTVLLSRTRQKIARDGEHRTVEDLVVGKPSDGFAMLIERGWPELTFEAVALDFPDRFDHTTLTAAQARLEAADELWVSK